MTRLRKGSVWASGRTPAPRALAGRERLVLLRDGGPLLVRLAAADTAEADLHEVRVAAGRHVLLWRLDIELPSPRTAARVMNAGPPWSIARTRVGMRTGTPWRPSPIAASRMNCGRKTKCEAPAARSAHAGAIER